MIRPWSLPMYPTGHLKVLKGNLAPEGCIAKTSGIKEPRFVGPARVFDSEHDVIKAILGKKIKTGDVIVIRYEGPKGGPEHAGNAPHQPRLSLGKELLEISRLDYRRRASPALLGVGSLGM